MRAPLRGLALAAATAGAVFATTPALAAPTGPYAAFKTCPLGNPAVTQCLTFTGTSGAFKFGSTQVPVSKPITLAGGYSVSDDGSSTTFYGASGGPTLSPTALPVPGGLLGLMDTKAFGGPLLRAFQAAVGKANGVTATPQLVGPVRFDLNGFFLGGETIVLPLRIKLDNPFLGSGCYIGSASKPVTLRLTVGTTAPPKPNAPITGSMGDISGDDAGVIYARGAKFVDNAFAVPAASGCGTTFLDEPLITTAVNLKSALPSAAGRNSAVLSGDAAIVDAASVRG